ncbi:MAG: thiamine pyrophosphate-dependent enzyme [Steroidobacteraceae bacterium]
MAERSFAKEVQSLRLGDGETFEGEAILAVTKALLQAGVGYVGGYQGAPVSHLMDVLADASEILAELGVSFESSASEATAAAMLATSINYPIRGAVTWKSTVGTNVASDALANLASAGVTGGAMIVVGEDYGEGASIMQERTHAFAMKSQMWLLDPRTDLPTMVRMVEQGFDLSEASHTPVMFMMRIRACHMYGSFETRNNRKPSFTAADALAKPERTYDRIILPPSTYLQEQEKINERWPAAVRYIREHRLNEVFGPADGAVGLVVQGGLYNTVMRGLERLGLADIYGETRIPVYVLNVTYPLIPDELEEFAAGKKALLVIEEGQPEFLEQAIASQLAASGCPTRVVGKGPLPRAGEYTGAVVLEGLRRFLADHAPEALHPVREIVVPLRPSAQLAANVPPRPSGLCTGCPERPLFASLNLLQREMGALHVSADIGCHSFATLPPFNLGASIMGYGLGSAGASALNRVEGRRAISLMGDGGFWHNGLTSGIGNAVYNKHDGVTIIVDNGYSAATGGQFIPSSRGEMTGRDLKHPIEKAVRGVGVEWVRRIGTYDMKESMSVLREALTTPFRGPKVVIAEGECQLNRQRRIGGLLKRREQEGGRVVKERFGVDEQVCTGDHSCIRLSGCPSLTLKPSSDPLRPEPVAHVDHTCVGCGVCGEVAHAAILCPSFHRVDTVLNPGRWERWLNTLRRRVITWLAGAPREVAS